MKYTPEQIQHLKEFLSWNVKEGYLDEDLVEDLLEAEDWEEAERMMDMSEAYANRNE